jgi:hypothetical protein
MGLSMKQRSMAPGDSAGSHSETALLLREISALKAESERLRRQLENVQIGSHAQIRLQLDTHARTGRLSAVGGVLVLEDQWVEFFCLLLLKSEHPDLQHRFLTASELNTVGYWRRKDEQSVGKEVARFLKLKLERNGCGGAVESVRRTGRWCLGAAVVLDGEIPKGALAEFLRAHGWEQSGIQSVLELPGFVDWVVKATKALMDLQLGEVGQAQQSAQQLVRETHDPILARIARILAIRAIQRAGSSTEKADIDVGEYDRVPSWGVGSLARAFHARAVALKKHWVRPDEYHKELDNIRDLVVDAEAAGDIGAIGILYGTLAVLSRRAGLYHDAEVALRRAIPLLIANGDVLNLQGALFNLGHVIERIVRNEGRYDYRLARAMLQLDMELREKFNLGNDSAQCEILIALILAELAPQDRTADEYLTKAERIIARNQSAYDQACWYRAQAKLLYRRAEADGNLSEPGRRKDIIHYLTKAVKWFEKADRPADKVDTQRKMNLFKVMGKVW